MRVRARVGGVKAHVYAALARLLACSLARLLACSLARLLACSLARLLACSLARLLACSLARLLARLVLLFIFIVVIVVSRCRFRPCRYPWAAAVPRAVFLDAVLPYASANEARNNWRPLLESRLAALVLNGSSVAANISDAATRINDGMWQVGGRVAERGSFGMIGGTADGGGGGGSRWRR